MFSYDSLIDIRNLEVFLFEGPETVEQIYERSDSFSYNHIRRRHFKDNNTYLKDESEDDNIWYSYEINPITGEIDYELGNKDV